MNPLISGFCDELTGLVKQAGLATAPLKLIKKHPRASLGGAMLLGPGAIMGALAYSRARKGGTRARYLPDGASRAAYIPYGKVIAKRYSRTQAEKKRNRLRASYHHSAKKIRS